MTPKDKLGNWKKGGRVWNIKVKERNSHEMEI